MKRKIKKIIISALNLLIKGLCRLIISTVRLSLILLFKALTLLVSVFYVLIDVVSYFCSHVDIVITSDNGEDSEFSTDPRFTDDQLMAMAKSTPADIETIDQIAGFHKVSFRQARKIKNIIKNPPVNINTYVSA